MATRDVTKALTGIRGRVYRNPTEIPPVTAPYGGTELGEVLAVELRRSEPVALIRAMEWGQDVDAISEGVVWAFAGSFVSWDVDAFAAVFPEVNAAQPLSGEAGLTISSDNNGTRVGGRSAQALAAKILFVPDDPEHPAFLGWQMIPVVAEDVELPLSVRDAAMIQVVWLATPDTSRDDSDDIGQWRLARDLTS